MYAYAHFAHVQAHVFAIARRGSFQTLHNCKKRYTKCVASDGRVGSRREVEGRERPRRKGPTRMGREGPGGNVSSTVKTHMSAYHTMNIAWLCCVVVQACTVRPNDVPELADRVSNIEVALSTLCSEVRKLGERIPDVP